MDIETQPWSGPATRNNHITVGHWLELRVVATTFHRDDHLRAHVRQTTINIVVCTSSAILFNRASCTLGGAENKPNSTKEYILFILTAKHYNAPAYSR